MRALRGVTQLELARLAKVSPTSVAEFELGKRFLRSDTIDRLCAALGVTVVYKLGDSEFA
jgi:transcriptional regulator with XRE-family HTH domain